MVQSWFCAHTLAPDIERANTMHGHYPRPGLSRLAQVPRRVWLMIGLGLLALLALLIWAAFALLGALWQGAGGWLDRGRQAGAAGVAQIETAVPGAREALDKARVAAAILAPEAVQGIEAAVPVAREVLGQAGARAQSPTTPTLPATDVPGEDVAGVPRHPALVRIGYQAGPDGPQVTYAGRADYAEVLGFYQRSLASGGFAEQVLAATPGAATLQYRRDARSLLLTLRDRGNGFTEARISGR